MEGGQLAPEALGDLGDRIGGEGARVAHGGARLGVLGAQALEHRARARAHLHLVAGDERVEELDHPRVDRDRAAPGRARQPLEGGADVRIPQHLEAQALPLDAVDVHEPRRRRLLAGVQ